MKTHRRERQLGKVSQSRPPKKPLFSPSIRGFRHAKAERREAAVCNSRFSDELEQTDTTYLMLYFQKF
jgi:hypothetical protein